MEKLEIILMSLAALLGIFFLMSSRSARAVCRECLRRTHRRCEIEVNGAKVTIRREGSEAELGR